MNPGMKIIAAFLISLIMPAVASAAYQTGSATVEGISYDLYFDMKAVLTGIDVAQYGEDSSLEIPESIKVDQLSYKVTEIGERAFYSKKLRKVVVPNTIKGYNKDAFDYAKLDSLIFEDGDKLEDNYAYQLSDGGNFGYIYLGREARIAFNGGGGYEYRTKAGIIDVASHITRIDLGKIAAKTINIKKGELPVDELVFEFACDTLTIGRNVAKIDWDEYNEYKYRGESFLLKALNIEDGVRDLTSGFIGKLLKLKLLSMPKSFSGFEINELRRLENNYGTNVSVNLDNEAYFSKDGVIFNGEKTTCLYALKSSSPIERIVFPLTVTIAADSAFYKRDCGIIEAPALENVEDYAFCESGLRELKTDVPLKAIGRYAFADCNLSTIYLDTNLKEIKYCAFEGCRNLNLPASVFKNLEEIDRYAFSNCSSLDADLEFSNLTYLGSNAFENSGVKSVIINGPLRHIYGTFQGTPITKVVMSDNVEQIYSQAFMSCEKLESVKLSNNCKSIGQFAFANCSSLREIEFSDNLETIGVGAFKFCTSLEKVILPAHLQKVSESSFSRCSGIKELVFGSELTEIYVDAFAQCSGLVSLDFPEGLRRIGHHAFCDCTNLRNVKFPSSFETIESHVFFNCPSLGNVTLPSNIKTIGESAFFNCTNLDNIDFQSTSIETIGNAAFYNCANIGNLKFPTSIKSIGENAFEKCSNMQNLDFAEAMPVIGDRAFKDCSLKTVYFGGMPQKIGSNVFLGNYDMKTVTCNIVTPPAADDTSFLDAYDATLIVPYRSRQHYMISPGWKYFAKIVEDDSLSGVDGVTADEEELPVEYYDLTGKRVDNPTTGWYIKKQGSRTEKVLLQK